MRTGEVADGAGVNVQKLRYHERQGLLPERIVRLMKRAQELGFRLAEVETLRELAGGRPDHCDAAGEIALRRTLELKRRIADVIAMRDPLRQLIATWSRPRLERECPLVPSIDSTANQGGLQA